MKTLDTGNHCCVCSRICMHIGPIQVCQAHSGFPPVVDSIKEIKVRYAPPFGWICPRCGVSNAPSMFRCQCEPGKAEEAR